MTLSRRSIITGLISLVAAPAIVRVSSIMPVKVMDVGLTLGGIPIEFDDPGNLYGCTCVYYQDRVFWLSPKDQQTVLFSQQLPKESWDAATFPFSRVDLG